MKLKKIIQIYKANGIKGLVHKIENRFYFSEYLYKTTIKEKYSYINNNDFVFKEMNLEMLNNIIITYSEEINLRKYNILKKRLSNPNEDTYVVFDNNEICGYFNIAYENVKETGADIIVNVPYDSIYLYDDYTFKKYRGNGVHKFSISSRLNIGKNVRKKYAYVIIFSDNLLSQKSYNNFQFKKIKKYNCFGIGKFKKTFEKNL